MEPKKELILNIARLRNYALKVVSRNPEVAETDLLVAVCNSGLVTAAVLSAKLGKNVLLASLDEGIVTVNGDVSGKRVTVVDAYTKTGATMTAIKDSLKSLGALDVKTFAIFTDFGSSLPVDYTMKTKLDIKLIF